MDLTFKLSGADKIIDRLSKLPDKVQEAASRRSARRAMAPVRKAAQAAARLIDDPETAASIYKNLYLQASRRQGKRVGGVVMRLGVLGGANLRKPAGGYAPGGKTQHWRFIELGTEKEPAQPFLLPSLMNNVLNVETILIRELNNEIDRLTK